VKVLTPTVLRRSPPSRDVAPAAKLLRRTIAGALLCALAACGGTSTPFATGMSGVGTPATNTLTSLPTVSKTDGSQPMEESTVRVSVKSSAIALLPKVEQGQSQRLSLLLSNPGRVPARNVVVHALVSNTGPVDRTFEIRFPEVPPGLFGWGSFPFPANEIGTPASVKAATVDLTNASADQESERDVLLSPSSFQLTSWDVDLIVRPSGADDNKNLIASLMYFDEQGGFVQAQQYIRDVPKEIGAQEQKIRLALPSRPETAREVRVALARGAPEVSVDGVRQP